MGQLQPIALLLLLLGAGATTLGLVLVSRHLGRARTWRRERATVTGYVWSGTADRSNQHWVMERTDSAGRTHTARSTLGVSWGTVRQLPFDVDVLVDPEDESRFVLAGGCRSGMAALAFVVAGLLLAGVGAAILLLG